MGPRRNTGLDGLANTTDPAPLVVPGRAKREAAYSYNHIVEPTMLLWIIEAAGVQKSLLESARKAAKREKTIMAQSSAIRKQVS